MRRKKVIATLVGGAAALLLVGSAMAHPGFGIIDRVDVLAEALGITAEEVETAKGDGTLKDLLADVTKDDLKASFDTAAGEAIDAASESGDITSTQAERLKEVVSADRSDLDDSDLEELKSLRGVIEVDVTAVYASLLDMTSEEVEAAKDDGTLRDLLAGVNRVALAAALVDARDAAIDQAESRTERSPRRRRSCCSTPARRSAAATRDAVTAAAVGTGAGAVTAATTPTAAARRMRRTSPLAGPRRQSSPRTAIAEGRPLGAPLAVSRRRALGALGPSRWRRSRPSMTRSRAGCRAARRAAAARHR